MRIGKVMSVSILLFSFFSFVFPSPATLVHNTQQEIDACMGKVQLVLVHTWGGDDETDEMTFFKYPHSIAIDNNSLIYISDISNFNIKVFNRDGNYVRTIGQKGRGPGDLVGPVQFPLPRTVYSGWGNTGGGDYKHLMRPGKV